MDEVDQIKERLDIVDIISSYLTLKKAGVNLKANCPFHNEKTPSFMVSPERQNFHCFGCNEGGDIFTFIEKMEGVDFYNALKILADKAGIELKNKSVKYGEKEFKSDKKTRLYEINEWAKKFYHKILLDHPKAEKARSYVFEKRRLKKDTVEKFEIGYAPSSWELMIKFLTNKGFREEELFQAGLAIRNDRGGYYDRFRGRIIFPINNIMGATIAFTSRILEESNLPAGGQAKYINSAESPIYIKGKTIYGLDKAKLAIKETNRVVIVEGNMDVIACHQAGFCNVVATSGTALTAEQLKMLNRYTSEILFSFDRDQAGEAAMKKAVRLALSMDINTKIISFNGPYKDPDEAITADPKNWEKGVSEASPSLEYWINMLIRKDPSLDISTKKSIAKEILPVIKSIYSDIEKEYYIKFLSKKLSVSEKSLTSVLEKTKESIEKKQDILSEENKPSSVKLTLVEKLVGLLWSKQNIIASIKEEIIQLNPDQLKSLHFNSKKGEFDLKNIGPEDKNKLDQLSISSTKDLDESDEQNYINEIKFIVKRIKSEQIESLKEAFARKIQAAEESGDRIEVQKLLAEFSSLIK